MRMRVICSLPEGIYRQILIPEAKLAAFQSFPNLFRMDFSQAEDAWSRSVSSTYCSILGQLDLSQFTAPEQTEAVNILMNHLWDTRGREEQSNKIASFPKGLEAWGGFISCQPWSLKCFPC